MKKKRCIYIVCAALSMIQNILNSFFSPVIVIFVAQKTNVRSPWTFYEPYHYICDCEQNLCSKDFHKRNCAGDCQKGTVNYNHQNIF